MVAFSKMTAIPQFLIDHAQRHSTELPQDVLDIIHEYRPANSWCPLDWHVWNIDRVFHPTVNAPYALEECIWENMEFFLEEGLLLQRPKQVYNLLKKLTKKYGPIGDITHELLLADNLLSLRDSIVYPDPP